MHSHKEVRTLTRLASYLLAALLVIAYPGVSGDHGLGVARSAPTSAGAPEIRLPLKDGSVRFAVIGDNGTGEAPEQEVADQMQRYWNVVKFNFVTMNGDNIYGGHSPKDFKLKFEVPYSQLLSEDVKFYASLGNHDDPDLEKNYSHTTWVAIAIIRFARGRYSSLRSTAITWTRNSWLGLKTN